ncbi:GNAT family N-acetyltransferase [Microbacterium aoyamense]|uniref:GNAT family N-acetyltransferase n=1 Tax=Microbacterium aoyamense TaxID=344166 RepID=A0ABN2PDW8_9MICO|nr:N-acetyltransferase [Microbacterium aoyamense]
MDFVIRRPTLDDADAIAALHVATWRETYGRLLPDGFFTPDFVDGRRRMWRHVLGEPSDDRVVQVAESGGELVGFAFVGPAFGPEGADLPRDRHLYSIYVRDSHHGTGIGQALLDAALGDGPAMLWVAKENPRAIAFYRRNGFDFEGTEQVDDMAPAITEALMIR